MFFRKLFLQGLYFDKPNDNPEGDPDKDKDPEGGDVKLTAEQQAHVDKIIGATRKQAREGAIQSLLKDLGVEKPDDLKAILAKVKELETANLTETQRLTKAAEDAKKEADQAKAERATALAKANERLLKAAVLSLATAFHDPEDAWLRIDRSKLKLDDETGEIADVEAAKKLLEELAKAKPHLVKTTSSQQGTPRRGEQKQTGKQEQKQETPQQPLVRF